MEMPKASDTAKESFAALLDETVAIKLVEQASGRVRSRAR